MNSPHTSIGFFYDFRPVGQGLFSIGRLTRQDETKTEGHDHFTWVHDCGAETTFGKFDAKEAAKQRLAREVNILAAILENDGPLDLLILSHFDNDHIAGLVDLLTLRRVNRLVIPYLTPAERLLILLIDDDPSEDLQRFLAGPVAFVRTLRGGEGAEIMFIGEPPENSTNNEVGGDLNPDDTGKAEKNIPFTKEQEATDPDLDPAKRRSTLMKEETTPLTVWGLWEFCFYNLPPEEVNRDVELKDLWKALESDFREFHRRATARETQADLVAKMRKTYRDIFGDSAKQRNDISLITYTGPVGRNLLSRGICPAPLSKLYPAGDDARPKHVAPDQTQLRCHFEWTAGAGWRTVFDSSKPSLLYTGDITLTDPRTNEVKRLLTDIRWNNIEVFQVPHHGAKDSWKIKPASVGLFTHRYSVFSSARYHDKYFHPRDKVLEDLKNTTRILVNEYTGAVFHGCAMWRASK